MNLVPDEIKVCARCGYAAWRDGYPCNRCGGLEPMRFVPEAEVERLREAALFVIVGVLVGTGRTRKGAEEVAAELLDDTLALSESRASEDRP